MAGSLSECAQMIRIGQRKSRPFKSAWEAYCSMSGSTIHDPAKHDDHFVTAFLDTFGTMALKSKKRRLDDAALESQGPPY